MSEAVYIGLGSNLGERDRHLLAAVSALSSIDSARLLRTSSVYESAPVGPDQPRFLNAAVELACELPPQRLLAILKQIELDLGRQPAERWGPRVIDLDVLYWRGRLVADANLQVPHLELHSRRFALEPLCDLVPHERHPVLGVTFAHLLDNVRGQDVVAHESVLWPPPGFLGEEDDAHWFPAGRRRAVRGE